MEKVIPLVNKTSPPQQTKQPTYYEIMLDHLNNLDDHHKNKIIETLIISGENDEGIFFVVVEGESISKAIGLLEVNKMSILDSYSDFS